MLVWTPTDDSKSSPHFRSLFSFLSVFIAAADPSANTKNDTTVSCRTRRCSRIQQGRKVTPIPTSHIHGQSTHRRQSCPKRHTRTPIHVVISLFPSSSPSICLVIYLSFPSKTSLARGQTAREKKSCSYRAAFSCRVAAFAELRSLPLKIIHSSRILLYIYLYFPLVLPVAETCSNNKQHRKSAGLILLVLRTYTARFDDTAFFSPCIQALGDNFMCSRVGAV